MSIVVEHEKRRQQILRKALDVFGAEGFENATIQKIADCCGITRTTLYIYFKNKKEIFNYSIKQLLESMENQIEKIRADSSLGSAEKITRVLRAIFEQLQKNRRLLEVILDYLLYLHRNGADPNLRVRRRTLRLRHILASLVIEGIRAGEIRGVNIRALDDLLYSLLEAAIFRVAVLKLESPAAFTQSVELAMNLLRSKE
ncbi:MAG: TetR/AcrR family transcriptional regulator [Spirochaetaceae bacterium]|jgi:AcrR family transcriptional regulator|nr:TetR/AcrR family transcriptional regulator [Spirochaetaceae bacterium]